MKKRAQSEIITTVLLVLIALAAVAIIAVFIINLVKTNTNTAASKAACTLVDVEITKAVIGAQTVTVKNNGNDFAANTKIVVVSGGTSFGTLTIDATNGKALTTMTVSNDTATKVVVTGTVEAGVILPDGTACPTKATTAATAS